MIRCINGGSEHTHKTPQQVDRCAYYFGATAPIQAPAPVAPVPVPASLSKSSGWRGHPASRAQINKVDALGGDAVHAAKLTKGECSDYIENLLNAQHLKPKEKRVEDPRMTMIEGLLSMVPDGYYATAPDGEGGHVDFIRLSRPTRGKFDGAVKVQTQHSDRWEEALVRWPSGQWSIYKRNVIDTLMLVIQDHRLCAMRYAIKFKSCCVCNTGLTDDRSRHYLIGPVCDQKPQWRYKIEEVDDINGGLSFEQLVARGLPTQVWQERHLRNLVAASRTA